MSSIGTPLISIVGMKIFRIPPTQKSTYERRAKQRREDLEHVSALGG
jgi:hypothetical protein